ncbi:hypothetical protein NKH18_18695 [Streptomyces sp. M10(2022)]
MISLIAAVIAVTGAVITAGIGFWWQSRLKSVERHDYMSRYRDSLLWVAFDLQSRIYNILFGHMADRDASANGFMQGFLIEGTDRQAKYARFSTAYVFAEYLGWAEIFRRDIQFLDLGKNDRNRKVLLCLANVSRTLSSARIPGISYRLFRADQRAIGELMIADDSTLVTVGVSATPSSPTRSCAATNSASGRKSSSSTLIGQPIILMRQPSGY